MSANGTIIAFDSSFFKAVPAAYFRISPHTKQPVLIIPLDGSEAALPFNGIKSEFGIADDSTDGQMLGLVARALQFVHSLTFGDPIPKEVLTGEASWSVTDKHRQIALQRLTMQLVSWFSGAETAITDPKHLLQIAADPDMRRKASQALDKAAAQLGLGRDVIEARVALLGEELAYVEALRETVQSVRGMADKVAALRRQYASERSVMEVAASVTRLMGLALKFFANTFDNLDAQTSEIVGALQNCDAQKTFLQQARNELYCRLRAWDDILAAWAKAEPRRGLDKPLLLRDAYQFLAPRFMPSEQWILAGKLTQARVVDGEGRRVIPNSLRW